MQQISWNDFLIIFFSGAALGVFLLSHLFTHTSHGEVHGEHHMTTPITTEL